MPLPEASYTLLLYDELLEWSERPLREFLNYPMQTEWQRKEYLHLTIVENFDRGKVRTCPLSFLPVCRVLSVSFCLTLTDTYSRAHTCTLSFSLSLSLFSFSLSLTYFLVFHCSLASCLLISHFSCFVSLFLLPFATHSLAHAYTHTDQGFVGW